MRTGILALQGSFYEHAESLKLINHDYVFVRNPEDINNIDSIILPGGETTSMIKIQENNTLFENIKEFIQSGAPTLGTCAGLILLSKQTILGRNTLNVIDSEKAQIEALTNLSEGVKANGKVYISVYEGSRVGVGKKTSSGYQQNKKTKDYLTTVRKVFPDAKIENGMIVATN